MSTEQQPDINATLDTDRDLSAIDIVMGCPTTEDGRWPDLMIDIETMGKGTNALILSIGVVAFDRDGTALGPDLHLHIDAEQAVRGGAVIDISTVLWWLQQTYDARAALVGGQVCAMHESKVLTSLHDWFKVYMDPDARVWALPPLFDLRLIHEMAARRLLPLPWKHWRERCLRTVADEHPRGAELRVRPELAHDALSDAVAQAQWVMALRANKV